MNTLENAGYVTSAGLGGYNYATQGYVATAVDGLATTTTTDSIDTRVADLEGVTHILYDSNGDLTIPSGSFRVGNVNGTTQPQFFVKNEINATDADYNDRALVQLKAGNSDHNGFLIDMDDDDAYSTTGNNNFVFKIRTKDDAIAAATDADTKFVIRPSGRVLINYGDTYKVNTDDPYLAVNGDTRIDGDLTVTGMVTGTVEGNIDASQVTTGTLTRPIETTTGVFTGDGNVLLVGTGGKLGLTINDGEGNANLTFNHASRIPDQNGSAGRIDCGVDGTNGYMRLRVKNSVTAGTAVSLSDCFRIEEEFVRAYDDLYVDGNMGVGTITPAQKLDVNGNIKLDGSGRQIYLDTGGAGLYWGSGYSRIVDDGDLRICTDDDLHFTTGVIHLRWELKEWYYWRTDHWVSGRIQVILLMSQEQPEPTRSNQTQSLRLCTQL